jgi:hypothetical protein
MGITLSDAGLNEPFAQLGIFVAAVGSIVFMVGWVQHWWACK